VWVALHVKQIPYQESLISLQNKPAWYKQLVPTTLVPAVLFHGSDEDKHERKIVWESMDILKALDDEFPDTPKVST
jgi:glutathione S-transferase